MDKYGINNIYMWLELDYYQLYIDCYNYKMFYVSPMVTTEEKRKKKRKESKHITATNNTIS